MKTESISNKTDGVLNPISNLGGKYLTFKLFGETYGLDILKVQEIIGIMEITRLPRTPEYLRGIINLRGRVIPVLELRAKFELESVEDTKRTCIIVMRIQTRDKDLIMGILVDEVSEVLDIAHEDISETPEMGEGIRTEYLSGIGKVNKSVIMLLNIERVLTNQEYSEIANIGQ